MRSQTSYLVVMMCMMGCFAVVQMNPFGLLLHPSNLIVAAALLIGAALVASRRASAYLIGLGAAGVTALLGGMGAAGMRGIRLPGNPIIWVVIGLYIAFRLTLIQQNERRQVQLQAQRGRLQADKRQAPASGSPAGEAASQAPSARQPAETSSGDPSGQA